MTPTCLQSLLFFVLLTSIVILVGFSYTLNPFSVSHLLQNVTNVPVIQENDQLFTTLDNLSSYRVEMKERGYELPEDHEFKSPYIIAPGWYPSASNQDEYVSTNQSRKLKIIQCYNCLGWYVNEYPGNLNVYNRDFKVCPYSNCQFRNGGDHRTADVLLIFVGYLNRKNHPLPNRSEGQIWVKCFWESPVHYDYPQNYRQWKDVFNWTYTYRTDSDIFAPNNHLAWRDSGQLLSDQEYLAIARNKTKSVAWMVSHCSTIGKREKYVKDLQDYIDVDVYGACGSMTCGDENACENLFNNTYKFYLSFENSLCQDYVTEKFFRSFQFRSHVIPVVRGGMDYRKYFPSQVFINTADFRSAKELALHLQELGKDPEKYARMLKEKDRLTTTNYKLDWCDLCQKLHTHTGTKVIPDIRQWSHHGICHSPDDIEVD